MAVDDLRVRSVQVQQKDTTSHALSVMSSGSGYAGNLLRVIDSTGATLFTIANDVSMALQQFFSFLEISAPGTPAANALRLYAADKAGVSTLYYKDDAGTAYDLSRAAGAPSLVASSITSAVSIANSATETQLVQLAIPAGTMAASTTFGFAAEGISGTAAIAPTTTWRVRIGTTTLTGNIACSWAPTPAVLLSGKGWRVAGELTVRTSCAGGTCLANGSCLNEFGATLADELNMSNQTATVALDTTAAKLVELTFQFGTADAANTLTCANAAIWVIKP